MTTYTLAGGCYWCLDAVFQRVRGVSHVVSGFTGGTVPNPSYEEVCMGTTGHAEAVQITFDEQVIPQSTLLDLYFTIHDPTTKDRQGNDVGSQYRSAMFYDGDHERILFNRAAARAQQLWRAPIVTEIKPLTLFYPGPAEHQDYFTKNPSAGYCTIVIEPKIIKARQKFTRWMS